MTREKSSTLTIILACVVAILVVPLLVCGGILLSLGRTASTTFTTIEEELAVESPVLIGQEMVVAVAGDGEGSGSTDSSRDSQLRMIAWNLESDGNDPQVISEQLREFVGYDVVALNEVAPDNIDAYKAVFGSEYTWRLSESGRNDRLAIGYSNVRFEEVKTQELTEHEGITLNKGNHRSPLLVHLKEKESALTFIVMTNHLARGNEKVRQEQAAGLREWARDQSVPVVAIGDFNFDYDFKTEKGNEAFAVFMRDGVWKWIKPDPLVDTNWSDDGQGNDRYPDSMLDFAFVAQGAKDWAAKCNVIVREGDFPDDDSTSDHRPIELLLNLSSEK